MDSVFLRKLELSWRNDELHDSAELHAELASTVGWFGPDQILHVWSPLGFGAEVFALVRSLTEHVKSYVFLADFHRVWDVFVGTASTQNNEEESR